MPNEQRFRSDEIFSPKNLSSSLQRLQRLHNSRSLFEGCQTSHEGRSIKDASPSNHATPVSPAGYALTGVLTQNVGAQQSLEQPNPAIYTTYAQRNDCSITAANNRHERELLETRLIKKFVRLTENCCNRRVIQAISEYSVPLNANVDFGSPNFDRVAERPTLVSLSERSTIETGATNGEDSSIGVCERVELKDHGIVHAYEGGVVGEKFETSCKGIAHESIFAETIVLSLDSLQRSSPVHTRRKKRNSQKKGKAREEKKNVGNKKRDDTINQGKSRSGGEAINSTSFIRE